VEAVKEGVCYYGLNPLQPLGESLLTFTHTKKKLLSDRIATISHRLLQKRRELVALVSLYCSSLLRRFEQ
jgi:hypothetical protein